MREKKENFHEKHRGWFRGNFGSCLVSFVVSTPIETTNTSLFNLFTEHHTAVLKAIKNIILNCYLVQKKKNILQCKERNPNQNKLETFLEILRENQKVLEFSSSLTSNTRHRRTRHCLMQCLATLDIGINRISK